MLTLSKPEEARKLLRLAQGDVLARQHFYQQLAGMDYTNEGNT